MKLLFWLILSVIIFSHDARAQNIAAADNSDREASLLRRTPAARGTPMKAEFVETELTAADELTTTHHHDVEPLLIEPVTDKVDEVIGSPAAADLSIACPNCTCVPIHRCKKFPGEQNRFNPTLPVHLIEDTACPLYGHVLCETPFQVEEIFTEPREGDDVIEDFLPCGRRNTEGIASSFFKGFKDKASKFGEFTWMAIVLQDEVMAFDITVKRFICGGSLIHRQVVMTAAHCVIGKNVSSLSVRLGDWDTQTEYETLVLPHEEHRVVHVKRHSRFHRVNLRNDIALLFLEEPVELKPHIGTLCLPEDDENFENTSCVATGFGKDRFHGGSFQNVMKQVNLPVVSHSSCQRMLSGTRLGRWFRLHPSFTCAGGEAGVDTCVGDGGSALACRSKENPDKYVQAGIVSWGIGCGEDGVPGVYTSVPKLVGWVNEEIAEYFSAH
ncbi:phenoloxidase-activating factor 2-like [Amphibalanus amphitrite]|uniref:phenoloxidase-activating factor 2-like n=1 Tax=Amphibalanus amphitrite TaxID=1232801 RepID=UPI001C92A334|nr:phenoloxidase-activating factor 2-like [Amphibalanus amphitrite]